MERLLWHSAGMGEVPGDSAWMEPALERRLASMTYTKRRDEARLGRWTAKTTVALSLGLPMEPAALAGVQIINAADGAPEVTVGGRPVDLVIGMTDRADWAVCSVLPGSARVGCDLELIEPRSGAFVRDYFTPTEVEMMALVDDRTADLLANLIWSAKESALKVLRTGLRRDTRSVEVEVHGATDVSGGSRWQPLTVRAAEGTVFPGWWVSYGDFVLTVVAATETGPPEALVVPPPLATAQPAHAWMQRPLTE